MTRKSQFLVFDAITSRQVEIDYRGTVSDVLERIARPRRHRTRPRQLRRRRGPGRPKLGVVGHEVTLLPRHWEWLNGQPGGASVTFRQLVDEARRAYVDKDRVRLAQESAYRFLACMAGDRPGFEEATRALFAGNKIRFEELAGAGRSTLASTRKAWRHPRSIPSQPPSRKQHSRIRWRTRQLAARDLAGGMPRRMAVVRSRCTSVPASASDNANPPRRSPVASLGRNRCRCSSVPN